MALLHEFFLLSREEYTIFKDKDYVDRDFLLSRDESRKLAIHDDIIHYINDTLMWIPTFNPSKHECGYGLNLWGDTLLDEDSSKSMLSIMEAWYNIFKCAPDRVVLTGNYCMGDENMDDGYYTKVKADKLELLNEITKLAVFAQKVLDNKDFIIYHWGI